MGSASTCLRPPSVGMVGVVRHWRGSAASSQRYGGGSDGRSYVPGRSTRLTWPNRRNDNRPAGRIDNRARVCPGGPRLRDAVARVDAGDADLAQCASRGPHSGGRGIRGIHWPFALAGLFAASLHYYGAALVVFQLAYLTVVAIRVGGLRAVPILSGLIALGPPAVELTLHLPYLLSGLGSNWIQEPDLSLVKNLIGFQLNSNVAWLATILVVPLASLTLAGRRNASRHVSDVVGDTETRRHLIDLAYLAVVPIGVLAASSSIVPTLIARNSIIVLPAVTILLAWWLALAPHACGARLPVFATVLVAVPLAGFLPEYVKPHKQQWREVAYEVVARADADTLLAVLGSVDALEDVTLASNDALRSWLWRHYLESAGADYERSPFRETMQFADRPPAVQQVVERAKALGRSRLLLVYAHWPPMSVEAMDTLRDLAVSVEHVALKRAGLYDVQLR